MKWCSGSRSSVFNLEDMIGDLNYHVGQNNRLFSLAIRPKPKTFHDNSWATTLCFHGLVNKSRECMKEKTERKEIDVLFL